MATLTISLSGSAVINGSKAWTITDADIQTLINGIVAKNTDPKNPPPPTPAQALVMWAQGFITATVQQDQNYRMQQAVTAINVTPITFT